MKICPLRWLKICSITASETLDGGSNLIPTLPTFSSIPRVMPVLCHDGCTQVVAIVWPFSKRVRSSFRRPADIDNVSQFPLAQGHHFVIWVTSLGQNGSKDHFLPSCKASTPTLVTQYGTSPGTEVKAAMLDIATIWPFLASSIPGKNSRIRIKCEARLTFIIASISSVDCCSRVLPAPVRVSLLLPSHSAYRKNQTHRFQHC